jgi:TRAP-type C4-dicarboxylate transport system permease small subunit
MRGGLAAPFHWFTKGLQVIGQVVLAFMAVTISYDALMRYVFAAPTSWSLEVNTFLITYLAVMTAAEVQRENEHIRITMLSERASVRTGRLLTALIGVVGVAFCGIMTWRGGLLAWQAFQYEERVSSALGTPIFIPYSMLPIGFGALTIQFAIEIARAVSSRPKEPDHAG